MDDQGLHQDSLTGVLHLEHFYRSCLARRDGQPADKTESEWLKDNILLAGLGLPVEQTVSYLLDSGPTFREFEKWIIDINGGQIDRLRVDRINRALGGRPHSRETADMLRQTGLADDVLSADDLESWRANGYVVVREAVSRAQAQSAENAVWGFLGMSADDPRTWYDRPIGKGIMVELYHHAALTQTRESGRINKAFAQLWGTADLWVTTDRTSFNPPVTKRYPFQGPKMHWDMSLAPPYFFGTQGLLYLSATTADQGAFQCVPGIHSDLDGWLKTLPAGVNPRDVDLDQLALPIPGEAGDLVIWHQALPHGASPNRGDYPRIVQYINMFPLNRRENLNWL